MSGFGLLTGRYNISALRQQHVVTCDSSLRKGHAAFTECVTVFELPERVAQFRGSRGDVGTVCGLVLWQPRGHGHDVQPSAVAAMGTWGQIAFSLHCDGGWKARRSPGLWDQHKEGGDRWAPCRGR